MSVQEIQVSKIFSLPTQPSTPVKGRFWFNTTDNTFYQCDGTNWNLISKTDNIYVVNGSTKTSLTNWLNTQLTTIGDALDSLESGKQAKLLHYMETANSVSLGTYDSSNIQIGQSGADCNINIDATNISLNAANDAKIDISSDGDLIDITSPTFTANSSNEIILLGTENASLKSSGGSFSTNSNGDTSIRGSRLVKLSTSAGDIELSSSDDVIIDSSAGGSVKIGSFDSTTSIDIGSNNTQGYTKDISIGCGNGQTDINFGWNNEGGSVIRLGQRAFYPSVTSSENNIIIGDNAFIITPLVQLDSSGLPEYYTTISGDILDQSTLSNSQNKIPTSNVITNSLATKQETLKHYAETEAADGDTYSTINASIFKVGDDNIVFRASPLYNAVELHGNITGNAIDTSTITENTQRLPSSKAVSDALSLKANDSEVVKLTGDQTITGTKIFEYNGSAVEISDHGIVVQALNGVMTNIGNYGVMVDGEQVALANNVVLNSEIDTSLPDAPVDTKVPSTKLLKTELATKQNNLDYYLETDNLITIGENNSNSSNVIAIDISSNAGSSILVNTDGGITLNGMLYGTAIDEEITQENKEEYSTRVPKTSAVKSYVDGILNKSKITPITNKYTASTANTMEKLYSSALYADMPGSILINPFITNSGPIYIQESSDDIDTAFPLYPDQLTSFPFVNLTSVYVGAAKVNNGFNYVISFTYSANGNAKDNILFTVEDSSNLVEVKATSDSSNSNYVSLTIDSVESSMYSSNIISSNIVLEVVDESGLMVGKQIKVVPYQENGVWTLVYEQLTSTTNSFLSIPMRVFDAKGNQTTAAVELKAIQDSSGNIAIQLV